MLINAVGNYKTPYPNGQLPYGRGDTSTLNVTVQPSSLVEVNTSGWTISFGFRVGGTDTVLNTIAGTWNSTTNVASCSIPGSDTQLWTCFNVDWFCWLTVNSPNNNELAYGTFLLFGQGLTAVP